MGLSGESFGGFPEDHLWSSRGPLGVVKEINWCHVGIHLKSFGEGPFQVNFSHLGGHLMSSRDHIRSYRVSFRVILGVI